MRYESQRANFSPLSLCLPPFLSVQGLAWLCITGRFDIAGYTPGPYPAAPALALCRCGWASGGVPVC